MFDPLQIIMGRVQHRAADNGPGTLYGPVVVYGDAARTRRGMERIRPGAFIGLAEPNLYADIGHDPYRLLVPNGQGLTLTDGPDALRAEIALPDTSEGRAAADGYRKGELTGFSSEMVPFFETATADGYDVHKALLFGLGVVGRPAFGQSLVQMRQRGFGGRFFYDRPRTVSNRGRQRKEAYRPGVFRRGLADDGRDVVLYLGDTRTAPVASRIAGTLVLTDTATALEFEVAELPDTQAARDFEAMADPDNPQLDFGVVPLIQVPPPDVVPDAFEDVPEPGNPGVSIRTYSNVTLTGLLVTNRQPAPGNTGEVGLRAQRMLAWL